MVLQRLFSTLIYVITGAIGIAAFAYPLILPALATGQNGSGELLTAVLLTLSLAILLLEVQGQSINAKIVAVLGVMVAMTAVLRFIEVAIPGPGGFSPIFVPIILGGYVFGARFGFLLGTMTLFTSALITGGVGAWLPYQMFAAGWVGLTAGWVGKWQITNGKWQIGVLAAFGFGWGLLYGAMMNLYFWPFIAGTNPASTGDGIRHYLTYYVVTSLWWDLGRAIGNGALLLLIGKAAVQVLERFNGRLYFKFANVQVCKSASVQVGKSVSHLQICKHANMQTCKHAHSPSPFDVRAWLVWVLAAAIVTMTLRNPLYSVLLIAIFRLVGQACALPDTAFKLPFGRITAVVLTFSTLFNMFSVHIGQTVLFTLPSAWPLIGGDMTLEAAGFGFSNGLLLLALLAAFLTFNTAVSLSDLARLTPRALHDMGMVVLIAITYLPETHRHLQRIREAQAARGHKISGLRDWQPLLIPLLVGGLERAMNVAEAMAARGYGSTTDRRLSLRYQIGLIIGLLLSFAGWGMTFTATPIWGWPLLTIGTALFILMLHRLGKQSPHTRYRPRLWTKSDWGVLITPIFPLLFIFGRDGIMLDWSPYPIVTIPPFNIFIGGLLLLFILPALNPRPTA